MNQSGQPRKSGKRGPMQPAPLTSGGLALEEITCRGWELLSPPPRLMVMELCAVTERGNT